MVDKERDGEKIGPPEGKGKDREDKEREGDPTVQDGDPCARS